MVGRVQVLAPAIPHDISQPGNRRQEACVCGEACQTGIARMGTHRAAFRGPTIHRGRSKAAPPDAATGRAGLPRQESFKDKYGVPGIPGVNLPRGWPLASKPGVFTDFS